MRTPRLMAGRVLSRGTLAEVALTEFDPLDFVITSSNLSDRDLTLRVTSRDDDRCLNPIRRASDGTHPIEVVATDNRFDNDLARLSWLKPKLHARLLLFFGENRDVESVGRCVDDDKREIRRGLSALLETARSD